MLNKYYIKIGDIMYKITICGHFGGNKKFFDGQTIKTKNLYHELVNKYGENQINKIDTYNWKKHPIRLLKKCINASKTSKNIIILPAHKGVKVFVPLFVHLKRKYKFNLYYDVIGGWLPEYITDKPKLTKKLQLFDKIFVETKKMKSELEKKGFSNIEILVNFKNIKPLKENDLFYNFTEPYPICTFSRVMPEKGIEDAIKVVKNINKKLNRTVYKLDIYGSIDPSYIEKFNALKEEFPDYIQYKGCVDSDKSINVLKYYYLLLFPTRFKTEGIPGTIIDALFCGVPVIATKWENASDILENDKTGYLVELNDTKNFEKKLVECLDKNRVLNLKKDLIIKANNYTCDEAIKPLISCLK